MFDEVGEIVIEVNGMQHVYQNAIILEANDVVDRIVDEILNDKMFSGYSEALVLKKVDYVGRILNNILLEAIMTELNNR
jgi:hypothetical protein